VGVYDFFSSAWLAYSSGVSARTPEWMAFRETVPELDRGKKAEGLR